MGEADTILCPYCATQSRFDPRLTTLDADPPESFLRTTVREAVTLSFRGNFRKAPGRRRSGVPGCLGYLYCHVTGRTSSCGKVASISMYFLVCCTACSIDSFKKSAWIAAASSMRS